MIPDLKQDLIDPTLIFKPYSSLSSISKLYVLDKIASSETRKLFRDSIKINLNVEISNRNSSLGIK